MRTERSALFYSSLLGLERSYLAGKRIFNIGAGGSDLGREWQNDGVQVINTDLRYKKDKTEVTDSALVTGNMTKLPYADDSADIVLSLWAAGYPPRSKDNVTLSEMVRVAKEKVVIYPCLCSKSTLEYIKDKGLEMYVQLESPKLELNFMTTTAKKDKGFLRKLGRFYGNLNYTVMELLSKLMGAKRLTIDIMYLKKNHQYQEIIKGLITSGLTLRGE